MASQQVLALREAMGKVVRALTDSKIRVRQQGVNAYVEYDQHGRPILVNLPSIPDNASQDLLNATQGFLDHEVSHLLHTDFVYARKRVDECKRNRDKVRPALWNIIEDLFVERAMAKRFTGSLVNIDNIQRYLANRILKDGYAKLVHEGADDASKVSYLLPSAFRAVAGQPAFVEFMEDKWDVFGERADKIKALAPQLMKNASTKESWDLVEPAYEALMSKKDEGLDSSKSNKEQSEDGDKDKKEQKPAPMPSTPEPEDEKDPNEVDDDPNTGDDSGNPPEPGEGEGPEESGDEEQEKDPTEGSDDDDQAPGDSEDSEGESEEGDGDAEGDPEDQEEGDAGSDEEEGESDDDSDSDDSKSGSPGENDEDGDNADQSDDAAETTGEASSGDKAEFQEGEHANAEESDGDYGGAAFDAEEQDLEDMLDPEMIKPLEDFVAEAIAADVQKHMRLNPDDYIPFTRDWDYVGPLPAAEHFRNLSLDSSSVAKAAQESAHVIQQEVERVFKARSAARWNPGQRKGKINRAALHRIATGDDRVFRQRIEGQSKDIAIQLVMDCSGSMSGTKIQYASIAAYMLGSVLQRVGVSSEIVGFTTIHWPVPGHMTNKDYGDFHKQVRDEWSRGFSVNYARYSPLALYIFKDFNSRFDDQARKTLGFLPSASGFMGANADGESIEQAAMRLRTRKEARKIMIVMSDGRPAADGADRMQTAKLHATIEEAERSGIEIYGLGLLDRTVTNYYSKCEVIEKAPEIPLKILALLQRLLTK